MSNVARQKNVAVFDTQSQKVVQFTSTANTFGELKADLERNGISVSTGTFTEATTGLTFIEPNAKLPEFNVALMRTPKSTKSGASVKEMVAKIKEIIAANPEAKQHFAGYSSAKGEVLFEKLESYAAANQSKAKKSSKKEDLVGSTKAPKAKEAKTTVVKKEPAPKKEPKVVKAVKDEHVRDTDAWVTPLLNAISACPADLAQLLNNKVDNYFISLKSITTAADFKKLFNV